MNKVSFVVKVDKWQNYLEVKQKNNWHVERRGEYRWSFSSIPHPSSVTLLKYRKNFIDTFSFQCFTHQHPLFAARTAAEPDSFHFHLSKSHVSSFQKPSCTHGDSEWAVPLASPPPSAITLYSLGNKRTEIRIMLNLSIKILFLN